MSPPSASSTAVFVISGTSASNPTAATDAPNASSTAIGCRQQAAAKRRIQPGREHSLSESLTDPD
ncbi:hypothetical protein GCM10027271_24720 [Saccharopolyspora gloriosae]